MLIVNSDDFQFGPCPLDPRSPSYSHPPGETVVTYKSSPPSARITYGTYLHESLWRSEVPWDHEDHDDFRIDDVSMSNVKDKNPISMVPEMRYGTLHRGLLRDEFGEWIPCTLRSYMMNDLKRIGRAEAIRRRMICHDSQEGPHDNESVTQVVSEPVRQFYHRLCEVLLKKRINTSSESDSLDCATDYGIHRFIRSNVFWVDLISKVRSLPGGHPVRTTAYPKPSECGYLLPLWQLILVGNGAGTDTEEVIQVVPYAEGRSLLRLSGRSYLRPLYSPSTVQSFIQYLTRTIMLMHSCGYCHRDVTPTNVLLMMVDPSEIESDSTAIRDRSDRLWVPVLADFESLLPISLGNNEHGWALGWNGGTRGFSAPPEAFDPADADKHEDWALAWDLWGLGSTCYALLWGRAPFWGDNADQVSTRIMQMAYEHPIIEPVTDPAGNLKPPPERCRCAERFQTPPLASKNNAIPTYRRVCTSCHPDLESLKVNYVDKLLIRDTHLRARHGKEIETRL